MAELEWKQEERFYARVVSGVYKIDPNQMGQYIASLLILGETGMPIPTMIGTYDSIEQAKLACESAYKAKDDKPTHSH
jgi:hypothetical protein